MAFPGIYILGLFGIVIVDLHVAQTWPSSRGLLQKSDSTKNPRKNEKDKIEGRKQDYGKPSHSPGGKNDEINQNELGGSSSNLVASSTFTEGAKKR